MIPLYHPELKTTIEVPDEASASVHRKSGWTDEIPKKYQTDAGPSETAATEGSR